MKSLNSISLGTSLIFKMPSILLNLRLKPADTMSFQNRLKTVGGPIDILVIKPEEAIWIKEKPTRK